jgi:glyoxylate reductase
VAHLFITQRLVPGALELIDLEGHDVAHRDRPGPIPRDELLARVGDVEVLVCLLNDRVDDEVLGAAPKLKVVATIAVGYDNIDVGAAHRRGIKVVNTPGVLDASTADIAVALMLGARRRTSDAEAALREGRWTGWSIDEHLGRDLSGATLGLVGFGRIARKVAARALGFDMVVRHHTRHATGVDGWTSSLRELASDADVLSIHVPLTGATHHLISAEVLASLRSTAVVVNTSRGAVLDEDALASALEGGRLWGAGLDVYQGEPSINPRLLAAPHTVLLPHIGSATVETRRAMCTLAFTGALEALAGGEPANLVPPPES